MLKYNIKQSLKYTHNHKLNAKAFINLMKNTVFIYSQQNYNSSVLKNDNKHKLSILLWVMKL